MASNKDILAYILAKTGCIHPFRASRFIALLDLEYLKEKGTPLTGLKYVEGPGVFFIEGVKELVESDECFNKREGDPATGRKGCIEYKCAPPKLPEEIREKLDSILEKYSKLDDMKLNEIVMKDPFFKKLTAR